MTRLCSLVLLLCCAVPAALGQDVDSGPAKGKPVPALKVFALSGSEADKEVANYAALRKEQPTIYVFIQADKWDRPMHRFLHTLGKDVAKDHKDCNVIAVWLTEEQAKTKEYLPKVAKYYEATALTYFQGEKTGPKDWDINTEAHATIIVAVKQRVAERFAYRSINETVVAEVLKALK